MNIVTDLKIKFLKYGVKIATLDMFNKMPNIEKYKTKTITKLPTILEGNIVYDISTDNNLIPSEIIISADGYESLTKLRVDMNSPLELKIDDSKIVVLENDKQLDVDLRLVEIKEVLNENVPNVKNKEAKVGDFVDIVGEDRISILLYEGCYNWNIGKACKFCDLHPKRRDEKTVKPSVNALCEYESINTWWNEQKEDYLNGIIYSLKRILESTEFKHKHLFLMAGNLSTSAETWNIAKDLAKALSENFDMNQFDSYLNIAPHDSIESLETVKKYGIKQVQYNLEIANKEIFEFSCPGKMKYDDFAAKLKEAVTIMGKGNVRSNFVLGLQDMDELLSEVEKFASDGIVADYSVFQPKKNTPYADKKAPHFDDVISFTKKLVEIYKKYEFKPIFCSLSSRSSLVNELHEEV